MSCVIVLVDACVLIEGCLHTTTQTHGCLHALYRRFQQGSVAVEGEAMLWKPSTAPPPLQPMRSFDFASDMDADGPATPMANNGT